MGPKNLSCGTFGSYISYASYGPKKIFSPPPPKQNKKKTSQGCKCYLSSWHSPTFFSKFPSYKLHQLRCNFAPPFGILLDISNDYMWIWSRWFDQWCPQWFLIISPVLPSCGHWQDDANQRPPAAKIRMIILKRFKLIHLPHSVERDEEEPMEGV